MFKCPRCNQEYPSYNSLSKHTRTAYKLSGETLYREYHGIKEIPTCKCGCGNPTKWRIDRGYGEYINGHNSRTNNPMSGKTHSENAKRSISQKRKEKFANGEYDFINSVNWSEAQKKVWQQDGYKEKMKTVRENKGWREKISKKMSGENHPFYGKKRPEHSKLMKSPEMIKRIFNERNMTDIEQLVALMLDQTNIPYYSQFFITHDNDTFAYDFKLKGLPILIEVDGDYWHGGPGVNQYVPFINEVQDKDKLKTEIAQQHGYTVLRFWGSDIKERPFWVIQQLLSHIQPQ
jgi:very-short-patch-repair endonuclease